MLKLNVKNSSKNSLLKYFIVDENEKKKALNMRNYLGKSYLSELSYHKQLH